MTVRRQRRAWDDVYDTPGDFRQMLRWATTHEAMVAELSAMDRVLEIGTGTGTLSAFLGRFCTLSATVDISDAVLGTARRFALSIDGDFVGVKGDAFRLPFPDGAFDAAYSQGLLEHFDDDDIRRLGEEHARVAKVAYVSVPSFYYPHFGRFGPGLVGNERLLVRRRWVDLLGGLVADAAYYPDFKVATFGGRTLGWPAQLLLKLRRGPVDSGGHRDDPLAHQALPRLAAPCPTTKGSPS